MPKRCTYTFRSGQLHPSIKVGGISMGQCTERSLPGFVFCLEHADKSAISLRLKQKERELRKVKSDLKKANEQLREVKFYLL